MNFLKGKNDPEYDEWGEVLIFHMLDDDSAEAAIAKNCINCRYTSTDFNTWREQIDKCSEAECIFYNVRPRAIKTSSQKR